MIDVLVHDFAGHPFQVELSRELARRGLRVTHAWCRALTTGRGALERREGDPEGLEFLPVGGEEEFERYSLLRRPVDEWRYGAALARVIEARRPARIITANTPLLTLRRVESQLRTPRVRWIFWLQDLLGVGAANELERRFPRVGRFGGRALRQLEVSLLRHADAVVAITEDFAPLLKEMGLPDTRVTIIENWAPLAEIVPVARENPWARNHGLGSRTTFLYSGTLGLKHDPQLILDLARHLPSTEVVVISEGKGADWLKSHSEDLPNLRLLPFQPYERLSEVLGAADVVLALLEPEAGIFSVPSKVLTYQAAGRPLLAAMPKENLASRIVERIGSGIIVEPGDGEAFREAGARLAADPARRASMGAAGRDYAERTFAIEGIADRFERVLRV